MATPTQRIGPALAIVGSCEGCRWLRRRTMLRRAVLVCEHGEFPDGLGLAPVGGLGALATPERCPELAPARLALARAIVAEADITGPARGVDGAGCVPDVSTLEATEARFACKVAMGLVK